MHVRLFVSIGLLGIALSACKGPAGPALGGTWQGFVYLHDEYGGPFLADSGITVTALPTSSTTTSAPNGAYNFPDLKTGVYSLRFNGTGFGTYILQNLQFVGGGTVDIPGVNLGKQSIGVITNLTLTPNAAGDTIVASGTISAPPAGVTRYVRLFFDAQSTVGGTTPANWTVTLPTVGPPYGVSGPAFSIAITGQDLRSLQRAFDGGATVNAIGYGDSYYENSFVDETTGKPNFPNLCTVASNAATFTMPQHQ
jgi:hypothetical protein